VTVRILSAALALVAGTSLAASPPKEQAAAVVAVGNCEAPATASVTRAFRNTLRGYGIPVQTEAETLEPLGGAASRSLDDLEQALATARDQFLNGQPDPATKALEQVERDLGRLEPSERRWVLERNVLASMAQIRGRTDRDAARGLLARIAAVDPGFELDRTVFPPSFRTEYDAVRTALKQGGMSRLDVVSEPPGVPVFVGGRPLGKAPVSLSIPPGTYRVEGGWGYRGLSSEAQVGLSPRKVVVSRSAEGSVLPDAGPCVLAEPDRAAALEKVSKLFKAPTVYGVRVEGAGTSERVVVTEYDAVGTRQVRELVEPAVPPSPASEAAGRLAATVAGPKVAVSSVNTGLRTTSYIVGAVGLVAAGVGTYFFLSGNGTINDLNNEYKNGNNSFQAGTEASVRQRNDDGKNKKTLGVIVGGVGVAALVTGITMFAISGNSGASSSAVSVSPFFPSGGGGLMLSAQLR
jgi:PEGA domain-containing protein